MAQHYDLIVESLDPVLEITRLAGEGGAPQRAQAEMFEDAV